MSLLLPVVLVAFAAIYFLVWRFSGRPGRDDKS